HQMALLPSFSTVLASHSRPSPLIRSVPSYPLQAGISSSWVQAQRHLLKTYSGLHPTRLVRRVQFLIAHTQDRMPRCASTPFNLSTTALLTSCTWLRLLGHTRQERRR